MQCFDSKQGVVPAVKAEPQKAGIPWTHEAKKLLNRVPLMVRDMVREIVEDSAIITGYPKITVDYIRKARKIAHRRIDERKEATLH